MQDESMRAIIADTKTQTRRLMTPQPAFLQHHEWRGKLVYEGENRRWCWKQHTYENIWDFGARNEDRKQLAKLSPYGVVGDRLWCKETWQTGSSLDKLIPAAIGGRSIDAGYSRPWAPLRFVADDRQCNSDTLRDFGDAFGKERNALFMPRWASRLTLEIVEVRVQRLQEIAASDACSEGAAAVLDPGHPLRAQCYAKRGTWTGNERHDVDGPFAGAVDAYATMWDAINGKRRRREELFLGDPGYTVDRPWRAVVDESAAWAANPWVWAVSFRRIP